MRAGTPASTLRTPTWLRPAMAMAVVLVLLVVPRPARAAEPVVGATWVTDVSAGSATFHGEIDPEGLSTTYRFEYATDQAFSEKGFAGAAKAPAGGSASAGSGSVTVLFSQHVSALRSGTLYHYRLVAGNASGTVESPPKTFITQEITGAFKLPDERGWELVSPIDKNGGAIQGPGQNHGGGALQAAAGGEGAITYSSASSFGGFEALGAPPASQYVSTRSPSGWATRNITAPTVSGAYGDEPDGVPYQLFAPDLARGLMLNGRRCAEADPCPRSYSMWEGGAWAPLAAEAPDLRFAGAGEDLRHVVLSTCAALTQDATEVPNGSGGCEPEATNLYEWEAGELHLIGGPFARLAAPGGAVSDDGSRVYFTLPAAPGALSIYENGFAGPVDEAGIGSEFEFATPDGAFAFFVKSGHLYRFDAAQGQSEEIFTTHPVIGVLGGSSDGSTLYFQTSTGLYRWNETEFPSVSTEGEHISKVAIGPAAAEASDYPPATGTARVSGDGGRLLFLSKESLTGYDNLDANTGEPDSEVYLWTLGGGLTCLSCNPTEERPIGPSTIVGAYKNGKASDATDAYKPRNLSAAQNRVFFDSEDALASLDTNKGSDLYEWEGPGTGSCAKPAGCLSLISSGTDPEGASFVDASESAADVYFRTFSSLVSADPGSADVYDARVGGGFPVPSPPIPCEGDACVPLPNPAEDPTVGTLVPGPSNPPVHFPTVDKKCPKGKKRVVRNGKVKCVARHHKHRHKTGGRR